MKTIARNSSPLPVYTVEKNRSSLSPVRSRITPMNQRKAMPANGTKPRASFTYPARSFSHALSAGSVGIEIRSRT
jgi:hypothetical protein